MTAAQIAESIDSRIKELREEMEGLETVLVALVGADWVVRDPIDEPTVGTISTDSEQAKRAAAWVQAGSPRKSAPKKPTRGSKARRKRQAAAAAPIDVTADAKSVTGGKAKRTKLTQEIADQIRAAEGSQRAIAKIYGISNTMVANIKHGRAWPAKS